jgi:hypothetical protein
MAPFPSELMEVYDVARLVNDPKNDSPECIDPALPTRSFESLIKESIKSEDLTRKF